MASTSATNSQSAPADHTSQNSSATNQQSQQSFSTSNTSLYVGELAPDVTEAMLFEIFNQIGAVASIRVCRDAVTRRSLGYAYVNYHDPTHSEKALDALNYSLIKGRPCRIMWSQRDPSLRKRGSGNIFIKNLDKQIDSKALYDTFSAFGNILSCKVATDENGSKGYGFVHYDSDEAAEKAIKAVNGMLLNDKKVFVGLHIPRKERESKVEEFKKHFTNVYVKNLPESIDQAEFEKLFIRFGPVTSCVLQTDENGKSKCFGFINYETHEAANECVDSMNEKEIDGRQIYVGRAQKKSEREDELRRKFESLRLERMNKYQGVNLYVKNLDEQVDDEQLRQEFAPFGVIASAKIMKDEKGASKGFGFVCYSAPEEANKAVAEMNGKLLGTKPLYVALAQRKDARRAMLEAQFTARIRQGMMPMYGTMLYPGQPPMPGQPMAPMPSQSGFYPAYRPATANPGMPYIPPYPQQGVRGPPRPGQTQSMNPQQGARQMGQGRPPAQNGVTMFPNQNQPAPAQHPSRMAPQAFPAQNRFPPQPAPLAPSVLAKLNPQQQRQLIGERLYPMIQVHPLVSSKHKGSEGKITGMLLEMEVSELLHLLESPEALTSKLEEAVAVLEQFLASQKA